MDGKSGMGRRQFLRAGTAALTLAALGSSVAGCSAVTVSGNTVSTVDAIRKPSVQYAFLSDTQRCRGCGACVIACRSENKLSSSTADRRKVTKVTIGGQVRSASTSCMHCSDPSCLKACPAGAIVKDENGIVVVSRERCFGCGYCRQACPYEVPTYNEYGMDKCDCCIEVGVAVGEEPYCVRACIYGALKFGTVDELKARFGARIRPIAEENGPSCFLL